MVAAAESSPEPLPAQANGIALVRQTPGWASIPLATANGDGTWTTTRYGLGDTAYRVHSPEDPLIHDLENIGDSTLRFVTVELKR